MPDLVVICPTRNRPEAAREAYASFVNTRRADSAIVFPVDSDDPRLETYLAEPYRVLVQERPGNMNKALNMAARTLIEEQSPRYLGFIGDDHRFRSPGWDETFIRVLDERGGGFVYGNDLFWPRGEIPTQIFVSASIVEALGWLGLPTCKHLYLDNTWRQLGESTKSLYYMPDVVIEHMHPAGGKAQWDEGHLRVNTPEMYDHDRSAFQQWLDSEQFSEDIERVRSALGRPTG